MNDSNPRLTIRGLDIQTKQALVSNAKQQGVSLNRYALQALKHSAGLSSTAGREELKQFLDAHHIDRADAQAVEDALAWADRGSIEKQQHEQL